MPFPEGPLPNYLTSELVAIAWIGSIPGLSVDMVSTQLPPDANKDDTPADWVVAGLGFATVATVGGTPDPILPVHRPVMSVDTWAVKQGSGKPPWGVANSLAEAVIRASLDRIAVPRHLTITVNGRPYPPASVQIAKAMTEPRRINDDPGVYAHYQFDLFMQWITLGETLA